MKSPMLAVLALFMTQPVLAQTPSIEFKMLNNFRTLIGHDEQERFYSNLETFLKESGKNNKENEALTRYPSLTQQDYETAWIPRLAQYDIGWVHDPKRKISLRLRNANSWPNGVTCQWTIKGDVSASKSCDNAVVDGAIGENFVAVRVFSSDGMLLGEAKGKLTLRDVLIVSFGDSFASGEGNPHKVVRRAESDLTRPEPARWWDQRCHRSLISTPVLAAAEFARKSAAADTSITFIGYACSGAKINEGILTPSYGRETAKQVRLMYERRFNIPVPQQYSPYPDLLLPPQIDKAAEALCPAGQYDNSQKRCYGKSRTPDYVLITTGGNEINFGDIVREFAFNCGNGCRARLKSNLPGRLDVLKSEYVELRKQIDLRIKPRAVMVSEYLDPTKNADGNYCNDRKPWLLFPFGRSVFLPRTLNLAFGISASDSQFAYEEILVPLNSLIREVANKNGWQAVPMPELTAKSGYCSENEWFLDYKEAVGKQGEIYPTRFKSPFNGKTIIIKQFSPGAMHPNALGHFNAASSFVALMK